ncbi:MAG: hypothetical protein ACJ0BN_17540 [Limisphaerales bacterium]
MFFDRRYNFGLYLNRNPTYVSSSGTTDYLRGGCESNWEKHQVQVLASASGFAGSTMERERQSALHYELADEVPRLPGPTASCAIGPEDKRTGDLPD